MESLQDHFLIATPQMPDPRFAESVIYICAHNDEGAMGLVINQPLPNVTLADILVGADIPVPDRPLPPIYVGGPVEPASAFFLVSSAYSPRSYIDVSTSVRLTRDSAILQDISQGNGPEQYIAALGYSGWSPGQLENELTVNGWLPLPAEKEVIFSTPDDLKWKKAAQLFGINISLFGDVTGSA